MLEDISDFITVCINHEVRPSQSKWFMFEKFEVYLRAGTVYAGNGKYVKGVTISNINVFPNYQRTGVFKAFLTDLTSLAKSKYYEYIVVENVINPDLRTYLFSLKYEQCPGNPVSLRTKL